jgi:hypothetical protein
MFWEDCGVNPSNEYRSFWCAILKTRDDSLHVGKLGSHTSYAIDVTNRKVPVLFWQGGKIGNLNIKTL